MIVGKISFNNNSNCKPRRMEKVTTPVFGSGYAMSRPNINNENGVKVFKKTLELINVIPRQSKMYKPFSVSVIEDGKDKVYGITIDKISYPEAVKVVLQNMSEKSDNQSIQGAKDNLTALFDNKTGRMIRADYGGMHFYRHSDKRDRKIEMAGTRYAPATYGSDIWGLTTYGVMSKEFDKATRNKETLGSIFWAMTAQNASIKSK